jgi:hypothetical protein
MRRDDIETSALEHQNDTLLNAADTMSHVQPVQPCAKGAVVH